MEEKNILEGILSVVDYSENDPCSGGPAWATLIGDKELCECTLEGDEFFDGFIGKNIRLTIEVIKDSE